MVQLGPQYDLAVRLSALEDLVRKLAGNQLGQAFSSTQSDGSLGMKIAQNLAGSGATALVFYQGPTTSRDPNTGLHPSLLYIGELFVGDTSVDSGAIFFRPDGSESMVIGNRGVQIIDTKQNTVVSSDETAGEGMARPWIPLGTPGSFHFAHWPYTDSSGLMAELFFSAQHPKVYWNASVAGDAGVTGDVTMSITVNGTTVSSATYSYSGTQVNISETLTLPQPFYGYQAVLQINGEITGGTGKLYCNTWQLVGAQS